MTRPELNISRASCVFRCCLFVVIGCTRPISPPATPAAPKPQRDTPAPPPAVTRVDPFSNNAGAAAKDPGFIALEQELLRAKRELGAHGDPPPHFIAYEVYDQRRITMAAQFGAMMHSSDDRRRVLDVDVRVGDEKLDSTHVLRGGRDGSMAPGIAALPLDADADAIRAVAWHETDKQYKAAVERFLQVKTQQRVKAQEEDKSNDFSREQPVSFVGAPAVLALDVPDWEARIRRLSARFRAAAELHDATVSFDAHTDNQWLTNSEGSSVQSGEVHVRVYIEARTRTEDGMDLQRYETFDATTPEGLPDEAAMARAADTIVTDLRALRGAPLAEPFTGPAILEGKAAGVLFHEIFGHRVEGHRQKRDEEGQTFAEKIGKAVMPDFVSVYDDPSLSKLDGQDLNGFYRFDDEGVPAQRASLVERGVLRGFLMSRSPTRGFDRSNGHGRRQPGYGVLARQGNLVVQPAVAVPASSLRERLRQEAKQQGKPYGLLFKDISGGFTLTGRATPQAFKVMPILVYRVFVDGRPDELVRGADIVGTPLASLAKILVAGDDYQTFNGVCGAESGMVPVSATSPSLLVQQIEIERKEKGDDKPPLLPAPDSPPVSGAAPADDGVVRSALEQEMKRTMSQLRLPSEPAPYYLAYTVDDVDVTEASATFGAVTDNSRHRVRTLRTGMRIGDPSFDNGNSARGGFSSAGSAVLSIEDDLASLRRDLWLRTDDAYKQAIQTLAKKRAAATSQVQGDDSAVPDFSEAPATQTVVAPVLEAPDPAALALLTQALSALLREYPEIAKSSAGAMQVQLRRRLLTSEGTWADQRRSLLRLDVSAHTQAEDGMELRDQVSFWASGPSRLPTLDQMKSKVRAMAEGLQARRTAGRPRNGTATVLFEGDAAAQIVKQLFADELSGTPPPRTAGRGSRGQASELAGLLGQKIAPELLSAADDPTLESGPGGVVLFGSYRADDEGVPAQRVQILTNGVLRALLMSRVPSKDIPHSNGHARSPGFGEPRAHIGNLIVSAKGGLSRAALLAKAKKLAKSAGDQVYVVRLLDEPTTLGPMGAADMSSLMRAMFGGRGGGPEPQRPLVAFQLTGGKETPVRGFTLGGLTPRSLKDIAAAGNEPVVLDFFDGFGGGSMPSAIVTPPLLFTRVEVREQTDKDSKPPLYPHPYFAAHTQSSSQ